MSEASLGTFVCMDKICSPQGLANLHVCRILLLKPETERWMREGRMERDTHTHTHTQRDRERGGEEREEGKSRECENE